MGSKPRRRIKTEEKVVAFLGAGGGDRIYSIPCSASYFALDDLKKKDELHRDDLKEKDEFIKFFKIVLGKIASAARNAHQTAATTFAFFSVFVLLLWKLPTILRRSLD